jgi:outer membrane protein
MMKELNDKDSLFVRDSAKLSPSMKEIKKNELVSLYQRVQNWNQQAQEMYQAEAQKKLAPLRTRAMEAIRSVASKNGYSYILDVNAVIVGPPGDDVLPLVKKELGIKEPAAPAPAKKP